MSEIAVIRDFKTFKEELDKQMLESAEGFVRIGYLLKQARDTDILSGSGYANVNEFARAEYNIDKTLVSRFININDRFSEGGNSQYLKTEYRGFGYSKLAVMLQLPDEINEELSPDYSRSEIEDIKKEFDEERKVSDLEILAEGTDEAMAGLNELEQALHQLLHDEPELYLNLSKTDNLFETLSPAGEMIYSIRIQGVGRVMMSVKAELQKVTLTNVRSMEKTEYDAASVTEAVKNQIGTPEDLKKAWEDKYGEKFPEEQKEETEKKRKDKKVVKAKPPKTEGNAVNTKYEGNSGAAGDDLEPKMPESAINTKCEGNSETAGEDLQAKEPENVINTQCESDFNTPNSSMPEMPKNAVNTQCGSDFKEATDNQTEDEEITESWRLIKEAAQKIYLTANDFPLSPLTSQMHDVAAAEANARTILEELKNIRNLMTDDELEGQMNFNDMNIEED